MYNKEYNRVHSDKSVEKYKLTEKNQSISCHSSFLCSVTADLLNKHPMPISEQIQYEANFCHLKLCTYTCVHVGFGVYNFKRRLFTFTKCFSS